ALFVDAHLLVQADPAGRLPRLGRPPLVVLIEVGHALLNRVLLLADGAGEHAGFDFSVALLLDREKKGAAAAWAADQLQQLWLHTRLLNVAWRPRPAPVPTRRRCGPYRPGCRASPPAPPRACRRPAG